VRTLTEREYAAKGRLKSGALATVGRGHLDGASADASTASGA